jgi:hypothetical protein
VLGDSTRGGFGVPTAIGFGITLGCAVALALTEDVEVTSAADEPHRHGQSTQPLRAHDTP